MSTTIDENLTIEDGTTIDGSISGDTTIDGDVSVGGGSVTIDPDDTIIGDGGTNPDIGGGGSVVVPGGDEITTEQRKKAVNLEDLVFVRQYIDGRFDNEVQDMVDDTVPPAVKTELETAMADYYNKTETDEIFYKRSDTVDNAVNAEHAANADSAENAIYSVTPDKSDNSTKIATTAFVHNLLGFREGNILFGENVVGKVYRQANSVVGYISTWPTPDMTTEDPYAEIHIDDELCYPDTDITLFNWRLSNLATGQSGRVSCSISAEGVVTRSNSVPSWYLEPGVTYFGYTKES